MGTEIEKKGANLPAAMAENMLADAEKASGFDNVGADDVAIPFITILQALSPQCRGETAIEGAGEGDFFNTVTGEVIKGEIKLIPCAYKKSYVEWVPRDKGGGFVKEHGDSEILKQCVQNERRQDITKEGNHIVTTGYHFCVLVKADGSIERVVTSFTSTQLKKSRKWNSTMMALMVTIGEKKIRPPMFSHTYKAKSVPESNEQGSWSGWQIGSPELIEDMDLYNLAKSFSEDVLKGVVKVAPPTPDTQAGNAEPEPGDSNVL
jgi:hypothetical protein